MDTLYITSNLNILSYCQQQCRYMHEGGGDIYMGDIYIYIYADICMKVVIVSSNADICMKVVAVQTSKLCMVV